MKIIKFLLCSFDFMFFLFRRFPWWSYPVRSAAWSITAAISLLLDSGLEHCACMSSLVAIATRYSNSRGWFETLNVIFSFHNFFLLFRISVLPLRFFYNFSLLSITENRFLKTKTVCNFRLVIIYSFLLIKRGVRKSKNLPSGYSDLYRLLAFP